MMPTPHSLMSLNPRGSSFLLKSTLSKHFRCLLKPLRKDVGLESRSPLKKCVPFSQNSGVVAVCYCFLPLKTKQDRIQIWYSKLSSCPTIFDISNNHRPLLPGSCWCDFDMDWHLKTASTDLIWGRPFLINVCSVVGGELGRRTTAHLNIWEKSDFNR